MRAATLLGGMAATLITTAALAQPTFEFLEPYSSPRVGPTYLTDISPNGSVVTGLHTTTSTGVGSFWNGTARVDYLPPQFATPSSRLFSVSGNGRVVAGDYSPVGGQRRIFTSTLSGAVTTFPIVDGTEMIFPRLSADGSVVAATAVAVDAFGNVFASRAVRFTSPTTWSFTPVPASAVPLQSSVSAMSDDANMMAGVALDTARSGNTHATIWRNGIGSEWLPVPSSASRSFADTISRNGQLVAGAVYGSEGPRLAIWANNSITTFAIPADRVQIAPTHISDDGGIASGTMTDVNFGRTGFIWTPQSGVVLARDFLLSAGVPIPLGPLQQLRAVVDPIVSADGTTIAGTLSILNTDTGIFEVSFFRATIPSPATLFAGALGLVAYLRRRRHTV